LLSTFDASADTCIDADATIYFVMKAEDAANDDVAANAYRQSASPQKLRI
jgi:hypothetical protein